MVPATSSVSQISTTSNGYTNDLVSMTSIPINSIPVSLPRSNSTGSITKLLSSNDITSNIHHNDHINIQNEKTLLSRASSVNNLAQTTHQIDTYHVERKYSEGSKPPQFIENFSYNYNNNLNNINSNTNTNNNNNSNNIMNNSNNSNNLQHTKTENSVSAPSTLTKRKPETKTGEVYV